MNLHDLTALVMNGESETLEFKETTGERRRAIQTMCAFLNQHGGSVLFGVRDNGDVVGQHIGQNTIKDLSDEFQKIDPPPTPFTIERVRVKDEFETIAVHTKQEMLRPYTYRGKSYKRVGNTTVTMSANEYNAMLFERMHGDQRWENQSAPRWTVDDLDVAEIRRTAMETIKQNRLNVPLNMEPSEILSKLGLLRDDVLLRAAVVLFGNNERINLEMPQCLLRVARFRGLDQLEFLDNRQFHAMPSHF